MSSLRRGHANLLCIVPILSYETGFTLLGATGSVFALLSDRGFGLVARDYTWGCSSHGRAPALHAGGTGIDTLLLHFFFSWSTEEKQKNIANPSFDLGTFRL